MSEPAARGYVGPVAHEITFDAQREPGGAPVVIPEQAAARGREWLLRAVQKVWPFVVRVEVDPYSRFVRGYDGSGDWRPLGALYWWAGV